MSEVSQELLIQAITNIEDRSEKVISESDYHKTIEYKVAQYEPGGRGWYFKTVRQTFNYEPLYLNKKEQENES